MGGSVVGHLDDGNSHVASYAEGDEETEGGQHGHGVALGGAAGHMGQASLTEEGKGQRAHPGRPLLCFLRHLVQFVIFNEGLLLPAL